MNDQEGCPRTESLSAWVDDELDPAQRRALEAHVAGCALCAPMLADMRRLHADFRALPSPVPDFDVAADVDRRIGALTPPSAPRKSRPSRPRWWQVAVLAPAGAVALGVGFSLGAQMLPAARGANEAQMASFSALPPGALCPTLDACARPLP